MTKPQRPAFYVDATVCSGCKACQIACKDRNELEEGRLWRRVYEVAGGDWKQEGSAWRPDIFAYNLSISCNHCDSPICVEGCPSGALHQRDDGIVLLDEKICLGCGYCSWSCPYGAPQLRPDTGAMSKCDFCVEELDAGRMPACVQACPVRVLDCVENSVNEEPVVEPLPEPELTRPALELKAHPDTVRGIGRPHDIEPRPARGLREWSLVFFTLLIQMAAGLACSLAIASLWLGEAADVALLRIGQLLVPLLTVSAMGISLLHLGQRRNMLRAMTSLRSSRLSREILLVNLFLVLAIWAALPSGTVSRRYLLPLTGLLLIIGMARVYMLRTVPVWNKLKTPLVFLATGLALGGTLTVAVVSPSGEKAYWWLWLGMLAWSIHHRSRFYGCHRRLGL